MSTTYTKRLAAFRQELLAFLVAHGYGSPSCSGGLVQFKADGLTFCVLLDDGDPEYVRISLPNFHYCDTMIQTRLAELVAADCQRRYKLGEYTVVGQWVSAQVPLLIDTPGFLTQERLFRLTQSLRTMAQDFVERMKAPAAERGSRQ
ncbi:hypothetical protein CAL29_06440 [Bordetella genomosp. 10]|uniref:Uncharacterized protein n=1 Tax=Bordetella genomosp. 10 TaxID=1416804 RepID=A0A261SM14_9BORD|nr:hypothetical protein [Bordetella genomosp. 10]OZI37992.1 hypothetical protein CAL29_06440 [Bordetella genomosp. 10]